MVITFGMVALAFAFAPGAGVFWVLSGDVGGRVEAGGRVQV